MFWRLLKGRLDTTLLEDVEGSEDEEETGEGEQGEGGPVQA